MVVSNISYFPFHIWDVIRNPLTIYSFHIFQDGYCTTNQKVIFSIVFLVCLPEGTPLVIGFPRSQDQLSTVASSAALGELTLDQQAPGCPGKDVCLWNMWNIGQ